MFSKYFSAMAIPTEVAKPSPSGPDVTSIRLFKLYSGCPGVLEPICLKFFKSSRVYSSNK